MTCSCMSVCAWFPTYYFLYLMIIAIPTFCSFVHMHLICACNIHSFSLARICQIECFRHAPSYLVTWKAFPNALLFPLSLYDREMAQLSPPDAQAPGKQQPMQPQQPAPAAVVAVAIKLSPLLACGPARVVCTDRGAVRYTEHHEPTDAVRLRGRWPLQRVRHGDL